MGLYSEQGFSIERFIVSKIRKFQMTFLSGESIERRLGELIQDENQKPSGNIDQIDCNSYELKVGPEIYVTQELNENKDKAYLKLEENSSFTIPSGQFAIILTEEYVCIPSNLFGLISMKSKLKLQGLINISGFHVDPGWRGRLKFSVYNAGPHDVTFKRGDRVFLIWFAELDQTSSCIKSIEDKSLQKELTSVDLNDVRGQVHSPQFLFSKLSEVENKLNDKIEIIKQDLHEHIKRLEKSKIYFAAAIFAALITGLAVGIALDIASDYLSYHKGYKQEIIKGVADEIMPRNINPSENKKK